MTAASQWLIVNCWQTAANRWMCCGCTRCLSLNHSSSNSSGSSSRL